MEAGSELLLDQNGASEGAKQPRKARHPGRAHTLAGPAAAIKQRLLDSASTLLVTHYLPPKPTLGAATGMVEGSDPDLGLGTCPDTH